MAIDPAQFFTYVVIILIAIGIHEFAHAKLADAAGDPTPGYYGRVTLNLFKHLDPLGTIMILFTALAGFGIGWGKPVPMDPTKMRNPRWDHFVAVLAGPLSNLLQAMVFALILRGLAMAGHLTPDSPLAFFLVAGVLVNLILMLFNLMPLGPLDGMWLVGTFLPERQRFHWTRWNLTIGQFVFLAVVLIGQMNRGGPLDLIGGVLRPLVFRMQSLLIG